MLLEQRDHGEGEEGRDERGAALEHVAPVENRAHDRGVGRRATDSALLERLDEARLGVARGRSRRVALGLELERPELVADGEMRKPAFLVPLGRRLVVGRFLVRGEKAAEGDRGSRRPELDVRSVLCRTEPKRERDPARVVHLRGDRPLPDELVERELVAAQLARDLPRRAKAVACRANRLVRLLRVLDLALVAARSLGDVLGAVQLGCLAARGPERRLRERGRVGAHVRDVAVVVEPLGDPHRGLGAEAELSARLLLQRRGHERRGGAARVRLLLGRAERERRGGE